MYPRWQVTDLRPHPARRCAVTSPQLAGVCNWFLTLKTRRFHNVCFNVSDHHVVHFKYLTILAVNCTSIKLEKNREGFT